jgi:hypothetical protein
MKKSESKGTDKIALPLHKQHGWMIMTLTVTDCAATHSGQ